MINELYTQKLLELTASISHIGHLPEPQAKATAVSKLCGSEVSVELCLDKTGNISEFAQQVSACALGQTSAAIVAREIEGTSPEEFHKIADAMRAMLRENGDAPAGRWQDLEILSVVKAYPARIGSTLLVFQAVEDCLKQLNV